ncbi:hypothetical protein CAC42_3951 [Sphaceloma murrayae]|uniref:Uncharacterized protein n=1 Tax=Sphaceloma murrayae TaxID=2082308 RepID=A0A2K1QSG5_9PEZI|nr:hypothetical protein CAC42_3951 [Sphaceloma murrayae]
MFGRSVGAVAAVSALTAQAMLIPPGVNTNNIGEPIELAVVNTEWQAVKLPCPECVFPTKHSEVEESAEGDFMFIQGGANSLLVNVSTFGGHGVWLGQYTLYPPLASYQKAKVDMIQADATMVELQDGSAKRMQVTVTADSFIAREEAVSPDHDSVTRIKYHIESIDNHPVTVDAIEITALKRKDGKMAILNVEPIPKPDSIFDSLPTVTPGSDGKPAERPHKPCSLPAPICHFRDVVEAKMKEIHAGLPHKLKFGKPGCHGRKGPAHGGKLPTHRRPPHFAGVDGPHPHRPEGHRGRPWRHHGPAFVHHHHGSGLHRAIQAVLFVLVPVFLGITMGMLVSLIGMIVGRLIAFVWTRFVRGGRRGYASVRLNEEDAEAADAEKDETESVVSEPLPRYEEAPAYEEKERA